MEVGGRRWSEGRMQRGRRQPTHAETQATGRQRLKKLSLLLRQHVAKHCPQVGEAFVLDVDNG